MERKQSYHSPAVFSRSRHSAAWRQPEIDEYALNLFGGFFTSALDLEEVLGIHIWQLWFSMNLE